jgi:O-antigen ligase
MSYPNCFGWYALLALGGLTAVALVLALHARLRLPRARIALLGWLASCCGMLLADRALPREWLQNQVRVQLVLYAVWYLTALTFLTTARARALATFALLTATSFVCLSAIDQYCGGFEQMRNLQAELSGHATFASYSNWLAQSTDPQATLALKKLLSTRVFGTFVYPNALGGFLIMVIPLCLGFLWTQPARVTRLFGVLILVLALLTLALTRSKAAIVLTGAAVCGALALATLRGLLRARSVAAGLVLVVVLAAGMLAWGYGERLPERLKATGGARLDYWRAAGKIIVVRPWRGWGTDGFTRNYTAYRRPGAEDTQLAHNMVLNMWTDYGLLGALGCVVALGAPLWAGLRRLRRADARADMLQLMALTAAAAVVAHMLLDLDFHIIGIMAPALTLLAWCSGAPDDDLLY